MRAALALRAARLAALLQFVELLHGLAQHLLLAGELGQLLRHFAARLTRFRQLLNLLVELLLHLAHVAGAGLAALALPFALALFPAGLALAVFGRALAGLGFLLHLVEGALQHQGQVVHAGHGLLFGGGSPAQVALLNVGERLVHAAIHLAHLAGHEALNLGLLLGQRVQRILNDFGVVAQLALRLAQLHEARVTLVHFAEVLH